MIKDKFNRSGKEQYRQLDTPKTEEKTTTVNTEGNKSEAPKKKKNIIRVFHAQNASDGGKGRRKPAAGERKGPARPQNGGQRSAGANTRNGESGEQRNGQSGQNRTQGGRPQGNRPEETEIVTEEPSREEEMAEIVLAETVPRMVRDVRQDRARETEAHVRMTEEAEAVSAVEQTVAREVRAEALKEEETEEVVSAVEQTVARVARADVPKAEEAETTVSAEQTVVARAADSVRDREEAVALQMLYSLRS